MSITSPVLLNVDDTYAKRYAKTRILRAAGFEVLEAATGQEAMDILKVRQPDLVLLDVKLPDINGRQLTAMIKADHATARVVVLQTSASHIDSRNRVASLDAGADGYLVEPMEPEELVANVRALLRMRQAEDERQAALDALKLADRRKDEFLAMLAHELRNPLAPIRNAVEIMRMSDDLAVHAKARELVRRQVEHLARLVDDLLEVSRITQRKVVLQKSASRLGAVMDSAIEAARPFISQQGNELEVRLPEREFWLDVDAVRLAQMIGNLLHNAAKFTPRGGRIVISAERQRDAFEIAVADNGVGMSTEVLPSVFELFSQADSSLERTQGGLGIGLSLVKGLVEMHGGVVLAESGGVGQGSRFVLRLPLSLEVAPPAPQRASVAAPEVPRQRILVVEDNLDAAEAMRMLLHELGHEVTVVFDGREAVDAARRFRPGVILLDIGLPGMDGYELASLLRGLDETRAARMIAVSGYGQQKDRDRSREAGFDLHLVKPVDPQRLRAAIDAPS